MSSPSSEGIPDALLELDFEPDVDPSLTPLADAQLTLEQENTVFFEACTHFADAPDRVPDSTLGESATDVVYAVGNVLTAMQSAFGQTPNMEAVLGLLMEEDKRCIEHFRNETDEKNLMFNSRESLQGILDQFAEASENIAEFNTKVIRYFTEALKGDLNTFARKARERFDQLYPNSLTIFLGLPIPSSTESDSGDAVEPGQYYPFCIQPPITPHDPGFMGGDFYLSHSDQWGTNGSIWVPDSIGGDLTDLENTTTARHKHIEDRFEETINPLGELTLRMVQRIKPEPEAS